MPNPHEKVPDNVPGPYYNDTTCIDCGLCPEIAPGIFKRQDDLGFSYVYRQPETPEEIALAEEARESCPTESIGNDGASLEPQPIPSRPPVDQLHIPGELPDGAREQKLQKTHEAGADA